MGTKRHYGIIPSEWEIIPANLARHIGTGRLVYGDFTVCPFTHERPGWMLMVCVQEAANLVIEVDGVPDEEPALEFDDSREAVP